jgi:S-adenosylmethionine synthetase
MTSRGSRRWRDHDQSRRGLPGGHSRRVIRDIGYDDPEMVSIISPCAVLTSIQQQSVDIALGVDAATSQSKEQGAAIRV